MHNDSNFSHLGQNGKVGNTGTAIEVPAITTTKFALMDTSL